MGTLGNARVNVKRIEPPDESFFGILSEENRGIIHAIGTRVASDTLENPGTAIKNSGELGGRGVALVSDRKFFSAIIDDAHAFQMIFRDGEGMLNRGDDGYNLFSGEAADSAANFNRIHDSLNSGEILGVDANFFFSHGMNSSLRVVGRWCPSTENMIT